MNLRRFLKPLGQTSVEYLLLISVSAGLGMTFFKKFSGYMIDNPDSYMNGQLRFIKQMYNPAHGYKKFRLPK